MGSDDALNDKPRVDIRGWTDDEWLAVMKAFDPDVSIKAGEEFIAERRRLDRDNPIRFDKLVEELTKDFSHPTTPEAKAARLISLAAVAYLNWCDRGHKPDLIAKNIDLNELTEAIDLLTT